MIQWQGDYKGCAVTSETSRTQQAAYEMYEHLFGKEAQMSWSNGCYAGSSQNAYRCFFETTHFGETCIDGTWNDIYFQCEDNLNECNWVSPYGFGCDGPFSSPGTWDVICETDDNFDCDSDGVPDLEDNCPSEHVRHDTNADGCIDILQDLPAIIQDLAIKNYGIKKKLISMAIDLQPYMSDGVWHAGNGDLPGLVSLIEKKAGKQIPQADADLLLDFMRNMVVRIYLNDDI